MAITPQRATKVWKWAIAKSTVFSEDQIKMNKTWSTYMSDFELVYAMAATESLLGRHDWMVDWRLPEMRGASKIKDQASILQNKAMRILSNTDTINSSVANAKEV